MLNKLFKSLRHRIIHTCSRWKGASLTFCLILLLSGCTDDGTFSISGEILGKPNMNIYIQYYGTGAVRSGIARVQDGRFEIEGSSRTPTYIEITDNERKPLGFLVLANGQQVKVAIDRKNPFLMKATGTDQMAEWTALSNSFAEDFAAADQASLNEKIEAYIQEHPDSPASAMLFLTAYDSKTHPNKARDIMQMFTPEVRATGLLESYLTNANRYAEDDYLLPIDTIAYRPLKSRVRHEIIPAEHKVTFLSFGTNPSNVDVRKHRTDTILPRLRELAKNEKIFVVDFSLIPDTFSWKSHVSADSATWTQAWAPGGFFAKGVDRLALPRLPYFIVTDSTGAQIYRGASVVEAADSAKAIANR